MTSEEFLKQYQALKQSIPRSPNFDLNNENCGYTAYVYDSSNCYFCFDTTYSKNCAYCFDSVSLLDCLDCDHCVECELLYECTDCYKSYNSLYLDYCARTYDSYFCWDCNDCHDIFGCAHLRQKQYCVFNKQYTKAEYLLKITELLKRSPEENINDLKELVKKYPFGPTNVTHSENSDYGNHVHYNTNCYLCFDAVRSENCGYLYDSGFCKDSYDLIQCFKAELCYECSDSARIYNCDFIEWSSDCFDCAYLFGCKDCHNCFGCVGLAHKKFCFLNKQYTEEEYKKVVAKIKSGVQ